MSWTIVPDHGTLHIRAIVLDPREDPHELTELIAHLREYLEGKNDGTAPVHPRSPAPDGTDSAAARAADRTGHVRAEEAAQAAREQCSPTEITVSSEGSITASAKIAGPYTAASYQAEGHASSTDRFGRRVPRYDE